MRRPCLAGGELERSDTAGGPRGHEVARTGGATAGCAGPVSAALGADLGGYRIVGLRASNPEQRLSAQFSAQGVTVVSGGGRLRLVVSGLGRGGGLIAVPPAVPVVNGNRVSYKHRWLREWWANGPLGLEQGFEVPVRPQGGSGALTISLVLGDRTEPRLAGASVLLGGGLRYGGWSRLMLGARPCRHG